MALEASRIRAMLNGAETLTPHAIISTKRSNK
jgi:hypothetical protein